MTRKTRKLERARIAAMAPVLAKRSVYTMRDIAAIEAAWGLRSAIRHAANVVFIRRVSPQSTIAEDMLPMMILLQSAAVGYTINDDDVNQKATTCDLANIPSLSLVVVVFDSRSEITMAIAMLYNYKLKFVIKGFLDNLKITDMYPFPCGEIG